MECQIPSELNLFVEFGNFMWNSSVQSSYSTSSLIVRVILLSSSFITEPRQEISSEYRLRGVLQLRSREIPAPDSLTGSHDTEGWIYWPKLWIIFFWKIDQMEYSFFLMLPRSTNCRVSSNLESCQICPFGRSLSPRYRCCLVIWGFWPS